MKNNGFLILFAMLISVVASASPRKFDVVSPDGTLNISIVIAEDITYSISKDGDDILVPSEISMSFSDGTSFDPNGYRKVSRQPVDNILNAPFYKKSYVRENYN